METPVKPEKQTRPKKERVSRKPTNRIVVGQDAKVRIEKWAAQIESEIPGFQIAKVDLINWLICNRSLELSREEITAIRDEFFDRGRSVIQALKELSFAQKLGDEEKTGALIKRYAFLFGNEAPKKKRNAGTKPEREASTKTEENTENKPKNNESYEIKTVEKHKE